MKKVLQSVREIKNEEFLFIVTENRAFRKFIVNYMYGVVVGVIQPDCYTRMCLLFVGHQLDC